MKKIGFLIFAAAFLLLYCPEITIPTAPLRIAVFVDKDLDDVFFSKEIIERAMQKSFRMASDLFERDIGRPLKFDVMGIVLVPEDARQDSSLALIPAIVWLADLKTGGPDFLLFFTNKNMSTPERSENDGFAIGWMAIIRFNYSEPYYDAKISLHEIGHLCGAQHVKGEISLMSIEKEEFHAAISYGMQKEVIKRRCGEFFYPPAELN